MAKKKKVQMHYLTAEQRPLFAPAHKVHKTKKDKQKERSYQKLEMRKELGY